MLIDPVSPVSLVAGQLHRPCHGLVIVVDHQFVCPFQQRFEGSRLVGLAGSQMKMKRMAVLVAQQVDFSGKTPNRTA